VKNKNKKNKFNHEKIQHRRLYLLKLKKLVIRNIKLIKKGSGLSEGKGAKQKQTWEL